MMMMMTSLIASFIRTVSSGGSMGLKGAHAQVDTCVNLGMGSLRHPPHNSRRLIELAQATTVAGVSE